MQMQPKVYRGHGRFHRLDIVHVNGDSINWKFSRQDTYPKNAAEALHWPQAFSR